ncbi:hypothetical protein HMPREF0063_12391 [Aeromicrobium marinum DSM 15272]|uniref:DUF4439 domain-containing protein n=1 Tax=Aeromicrobium marinum DSM 15272 TaxID=585531 RepID=E2SD79_9ACTN|nr:DUF4439 domain-containing protein [Aeromicrobium marinum]EFQ83182.1 hypothetical protein HMPREF0063_12391 [Aeromicrobium marinum DSM 15272]
MSTDTPAPDLMTALGLEHEAVWLHSQIAGRFPDLRERAEASFRAHRARRDELVAEIGDRATGPQVSYGPAVVADPVDAAARAQDLEHRIAAVWLELATRADGDARRTSLAQVVVAARARLTWGAAVVALPGLTR